MLNAVDGATYGWRYQWQNAVAEPGLSTVYGAHATSDFDAVVFDFDTVRFSSIRPNHPIDRSDRFGLLVWRRRPSEFHHRDFASSRVLKRLNVG